MFPWKSHLELEDLCGTETSLLKKAPQHWISERECGEFLQEDRRLETVSFFHYYASW